METRAFAPLYGPTSGTGTGTGTLFPSVTVTPTTSAVPSGQLPGPANNNTVAQIQIANTTTSWAYVNFGQFGNVTAATVAAGYPVAPGAVVVVSVVPEVSGASIILGASTTGGTTVILTRGEGL
jgi:hypothetical protein